MRDHTESALERRHTFPDACPTLRVEDAQQNLAAKVIGVGRRRGQSRQGRQKRHNGKNPAHFHCAYLNFAIAVHRIIVLIRYR
ncbi:hypothetical protein, partial [Mesorhizobium sp. M2A.F.Ca.ET.029.05.1.1]|uniref:hypothetical protein n=1 Tax=Mesorhizobium sp. M2A.F.Ca.ET.029.05.1.1 TaxID=2496658 RepID=UPI001AEC80A8